MPRLSFTADQPLDLRHLLRHVAGENLRAVIGDEGGVFDADVDL
jgi:hypothetical protein